MHRLTALLLILSFSPFGPAHASDAVPAREMRAELLKKTERTLAETPRGSRRAEKRLDRLGKRLSKFTTTADPDFADPVDKWLWFGLIGLGAAILLAFLSIGLGGLVGFLAVVCLVIWAIKRYGPA